MVANGCGGVSGGPSGPQWGTGDGSGAFTRLQLQRQLVTTLSQWRRTICVFMLGTEEVWRYDVSKTRVDLLDSEVPEPD